MPKRLKRGDGFDGARSAEEVPDRRFRGGNRDVLKSIPERLPQHVHFGRIVQLGSGAVGVHIRYLLGGCPRGFKRAVEGIGRIHAVRVRRRNVVGVRGEPVPCDFAQYLGASGAGVLG